MLTCLFRKCRLQSVIFFGYIVVILACSVDKQTLKIQGIEVSDTSPMMGHTFYRVYYWNDLTLYQSQYLQYSFQNQLEVDSTTNEVSSNSSLLSRDWKSQFFVFNKDSSYGYNYDPNRSREDNRRLRVDSVLNFIKGTNRFDSFLLVKPHTSIWSADGTQLKEIFLLPRKASVPPGSLTFFYSKKLKHLKESFNSRVDSAKQMKLFKTETVFEEFYNEVDKKRWPPTRDVTEMKEIKVHNPGEIMRYFEKYKNSVGECR